MINCDICGGDVPEDRVFTDKTEMLTVCRGCSDLPEDAKPCEVIDVAEGIGAALDRVIDEDIDIIEALEGVFGPGQQISEGMIVFDMGRGREEDER